MENYKIAFLVTPPGISGGMYVILQHAMHAKRLGHQVFMITESEIEPTALDWHPDAKRELDWTTYAGCENYLFDYAIATWWRTSFNLHKVRSKKYGYFVQSIESKFYPKTESALRSYVESTYLLPVNFITEATWIKEYLNLKYGHESSLAKNGIRKDLYQEPKKNQDRKGLRVLVEGPLNVSFKNVEKTIELVRKSEADEIWLLTSSQISSYPGVSKVFSRVPITDTPEIYGSCDVLVKLSYVEGMFGPPLEMFHCGGTAIVYDVSGHDEYIEHNVNGIVIKTDDEEGVVKAINNLKSNPTKLNELKAQAINTANSWNGWDTASDVFWNQVFKNFQDFKFSNSYLRMLNTLHTDLYEETLKKSSPRSLKKQIKIKISKKLKSKSPYLHYILKKALKSMY